MSRTPSGSPGPQGVTLPRLRKELRWGSTPVPGSEAGKQQLLVDDPRYGRRLAPRAGDAALLEALGAKPASLAALLETSGLSPDDAYRRLWGLARDLWFEIDALPAYDRLFQEAPGGMSGADPASLEAPQITREQAFLCTGCGRCCAHTDIGPISGAEVARIDKLVEGFEAQCLRVGGTEPQADSIFVLASRSTGCPYLLEDGLCAIHAEHGAAAKPNVCRQFPYRFTAGRSASGSSAPTIVTVDGECWDLERALAAGEASVDARETAGVTPSEALQSSAAQAEVAQVWAMGPVLETVPSQGFLDPFTPLDTERWESLRRGVEGDLADGVEPLAALGSLLLNLDAASRAPDFLDEARWSAAYPGRFGLVSPGQVDWLSETLARMVERWSAEGQAWRARLLPILLAGIEALGTDAERDLPGGDARRLFTRNIVTQFASENVTKKDNLEYGIVFLYWRMRIARAALSRHSAVDSMVATNKLLKDRRIGEFFRQNQVLLRRLALAGLG